MTRATVLLMSVLYLLSCKKEDQTSQPSPTGNAAKEMLNVSYGSHPLQKMDVYFPKGYGSETPVAFVIHGGGFIAGTKEAFTAQAGMMRDQGFITVNISHRLIDTTGLLRNPPLRMNSAVKVSDELGDIASAVQLYRSKSAEWAGGLGKMYMAGHSAGAILAMLYVQGDRNTDGLVRASGNWAGVTDLSLPSDTAFNTLPEPARSQYKELFWRATGAEPKMSNNLYLMAISPYWVANNNSGKPNVSIFPQFNAILQTPGEVDYNLQHTRNFHSLLKNRGIAEQLSVYEGSDHGLGTPSDAWQRCVKETADFFKAH